MSIKSTYIKNGVFVIELEGRLDIQYADNLGQSIIDVVDTGEKYLLFDLKKLKFMDSSGLRIFIGLKRQLSELKGDVKIVNMNSNIKKVFETVELDKHFEIFTDFKKAVSSFNEK